MSALVLLVALTAVPDSVFDNPQPWERDDVRGALTIEKRRIEGSAYSEYRISTELEVPVDVLCRIIFEWGTTGTDVPGLKLTTLLSNGDDERVVYNQVEQPIVSSRDYAMTVRRQREGGTCRIRFRVTNDLAPAVPKGFVRMDRMWGSWTLEPSTGGKTRLKHTLFADPSGSIPTFLVHGGQRSSAIQSVEIVVAKGLAAVKAQPAPPPAK